VVEAKTARAMLRRCQVLSYPILPMLRLPNVFLDDKMMMVWDLHPAVGSPSRSPTPSLSARPQPTAYVIAFPHPLTSISSHPSTSKEFLVSDCRGSIFATDWRSDPQDANPNNWRHSSLVELTEPYALSSSYVGLSKSCFGSAAWCRDTTDM
jgi:hypothetical protein